MSDDRNLDGGYIILMRRVYEHPAFRSPQEASMFVWMVAQAQWQDGRRPTRWGPVELRTGELILAETKLGEWFGMHRNKVRALLARMKQHGLIETFQDRCPYHAGTVCRIVKYEVYQSVAPSSGPSQDRYKTDGRADAGQIKDKPGTQNNYLNQGNQESVGEREAREADARDAAAYRKIMADTAFEAEVKALEVQAEARIAASGGTVVAFPARAPAPDSAQASQPSRKQPAQPSRYSPDAQAIVEAFDEARDQVFGHELHRPWPNPMDHVVAEGWIKVAAGHGFVAADVVEMATGAFREGFSRRKEEGEDAPGVLKFFNASVNRLIAARAKGPRRIVVTEPPPVEVQARPARRSSAPTNAATALRRELQTVAED